MEIPENTIPYAFDAPLPVSEISWTHKSLYNILEKIPINTKSLIDVGCGRGIIGALVRIYRNPKRLVGIDTFEKYIDFCRKMNFYDELYKYDLRQTLLPFSDKEFDIATCVEVIEHFSKNKGVNLLCELERIAKSVIVTTPNISFSQELWDSNPFQRHLSQWSVKDFTKRGYKVRGIGEFMFSGRQVKYISRFLSPFSCVIPIFSETLFAFKTQRVP